MSNFSKGTRARVDLTRSQGNQNAVASGVDMSHVGIIGESELNRIRFIAYQDDYARAEELARQRSEAERREKSANKSSKWPDTAEARHAAFLQSQHDAIAEAEKRKAILDQLHAEQEEADHREMVAKAELRALRDDPRGRNAQRLTMLHDAIKGRQVQIVYNKETQKENVEALQAESNALAMANWAAEAEAAQAELRARARDMAHKNANLEMVLCQIEEHKAERDAREHERSSVERAAAEEANENAEEEQAKQTAERECGTFNALHARSALTKSERLTERIKNESNVIAELEEEMSKVEALKRAAEQRRSERQATFEQRKQQAMSTMEELNQPEHSAKYRTQDRFANMTDGTASFMDKMFDDDDKRVSHSKNVSKRIGELACSELQRAELAKQNYRLKTNNDHSSTSANNNEDDDEDNNNNNNNNNDDDNSSSNWQTYKRNLDKVNGANTNQMSSVPSYRHAAATASGFINSSEEKQYLEEMRQHPAKLAAITHKENEERCAEAKRVAEIQRLQAKEKKMNAELMKEKEVAERRAQQEYLAADDEKYRAFLKSQLPDDLDNVLLQKAMKLSEGQKIS